MCLAVVNAAAVVVTRRFDGSNDVMTGQRLGT